MLYLRGFQLVRIFFQPERIARVFNLRELRLIVASIDFVGTKSKLKNNQYPFTQFPFIIHMSECESAFQKVTDVL